MARRGFPRVLQRARHLPRRMAREGGGPVTISRSAHSPGDPRNRWTGSDACCRYGGWPLVPERARAPLFCPLILAAASLSAVGASADEPIRSLRVWPSADYTRVTVETSAPLRYQLSSVKNPERLVLDFEDADFLSMMDQVANKVSPDDPHVANLRAGRFKPGTVRLVVDLKGEVKPQVFALQPIGGYGHRLVIDLYPLVPPDPLMALVQKKESDPSASPARASPPADEVAPGPGEIRKAPRAGEKTK